MYLTKNKAGQFLPSTDEDYELAKKVPVGGEVSASIARNPHFHRKLMGLLQLAFENWNPPLTETKWGIPKKNFTRFRKDLMILAGHFELTVNIKGEPKVEAESLRFDSMGAEKFEQVYKDVLKEVEKLLDTSSDLIQEQLSGYY